MVDTDFLDVRVVEEVKIIIFEITPIIIPLFLFSFLLDTYYYRYFEYNFIRRLSDEMNHTMADDNNGSSSSSQFDDNVINFEIQLISNSQGVLSGRMFYSYAEIIDESSTGNIFGDETISVQGMTSEKLLKIVVKAKNVLIGELSDGDVDCQKCDFEPDPSIHQEGMISRSIGGSEGMAQHDDRDETSSPSHLESCSKNSSGSRYSMSDTSQILLPVDCQETFNLDSKKPPSPSLKDNLSSNQSGSTTTMGDGDYTQNSNSANDSISSEQNRPPSILFVSGNFGDESSGLRLSMNNASQHTSSNASGNSSQVN